MPQPPSFEEHFLIRLAPIYLACRWRVMGHALIGKEWPQPSLQNDLLGMHDYGWKMDYIAKQELQPCQKIASLY